MTALENITDYIPQRAPFVMVDHVLVAEGNISKTSFAVKEDNLFVTNGVFTVPGLVENMAQTAAAGTGYRYHQNGEVVPVGFIGQVKNLKVFTLPKVGDVLNTEITVTHTMLSVHVVQAAVYVGETKIASCEMKIFEQS